MPDWRCPQQSESIGLVVVGMADFHFCVVFALGLALAWRASIGLVVVGMAVFHLCTGFAWGRALARRAFDRHIPVGIICPVFRQNVWTGPLCEYLVREIGYRVWCEPPAICARESCVRVLLGLGLRQWGFAFLMTALCYNL